VILDLAFMPFIWLSKKLGQLAATISHSVLGHRSASERAQPLLKRHQRETGGLWVRILLMLPLVLFVLFPFYWIIITSFKTDLQIQQYRSIYWPEPWTLSQFQTLLTKT